MRKLLLIYLLLATAFAGKCQTSYPNYNGQSQITDPLGIILQPGFSISNGSPVIIYVTPPPFPNTTLSYNSNILYTAQRPISFESDIISGYPTQDVVQSTEFTDGFGRTIETDIKQSSPSGLDAIDIHLYDATGRETKKYLPFTSGTSGYMDPATAKITQNTFNQGLYPNEANFYAQTDYENSSLNRPLKTYAPGSSWVGSLRGVAGQYLVNTLTDNVQMWNIALAQGSLPTSSGQYPAGQLYKSITTNEQTVQTIEFKDMDGHVVLKKVQLTASSDNGSGSAHTNWLCTYYVYDDYGNLRFVITPVVVQAMDKASSWVITQTMADELCNRTEYDLQNRPIIKKTSGSGEQWLVYDQRGRVVMEQDANMRSLKKWQYFQYDNLDRLVINGLMTDPSNYNNLAYHQTNASTSIIYPNTSSYSPEVLIQTYYDNYAWAGAAGMATNMDITSISNTSYFYTPSNTSYPYPQPMAQTAMTRGMVTGSKTEVLGSNGGQYLYNVGFYDDKGRIVQAQATNITSGTDKTTIQYSWASRPLRKLNQYNYTSSTNQQVHTLLTKTNYDPMGRMLGITKTISSTTNGAIVTSAEKTVSTYTYDETGRKVIENLGNKSGTIQPLETRTLEYNVRSWLLGINRAYVRDLSQINSTSNSGETFTTPPALIAGQYFGFELGYDKSPSVTGATWTTPLQYTGNIAGAIWKLANDGQVRKYDFTYDNASELLGADFNQYNTGTKLFDRGSGVNFSVSNLGYDYNGNIQSLTQMGLKNNVTVTIDQLTYSYFTGTNRLQRVKDDYNDNTSTLGDFKYDPATKDPSTDYAYDNNGAGNGNLVSDANRKISNIQYFNILNLPQTITLIGGKGKITYSYDASGNKLSKTTLDNTVSPALTTVTNYIGGFIYKNDVLQYFSQEEGRVRLKPAVGSTAATYIFDYFLKDQLGNVRMVLSDDNTLSSPILEASSFYPMGLAMAGINTKAVGTMHNILGYQGKEIQNGEFNDGSSLEEYDFGARYYDQQLGIWHNQDPAGQYASPYMAMGNNWMNGRDPNGKFFHIILGALIGGTINLVSHALSGEIHGWGDGFKAFGVGALAGGLAAATGGATLAALGVGGVLGGAAAGLAAAAVSSPVLGVGNNLFFGDPYSAKSLGNDLIIGAVTGGIIGGLSAGIKGNNVWTNEKITYGNTAWSFNNDPASNVFVNDIMNGDGTIANIGSSVATNPAGSSVNVMEQVPDNYVSQTADNNNGIVWREPGSTGNANIVRVMNSTSYAPKGYAVFYNKFGQPFDPNTGRPLGKDLWHFLFH